MHLNQNTFLSAALAGAALFSPATAHMIMNTPIPYNFNSTFDKIVSWPISYVTSSAAPVAQPFPCQGKWNDTVSVTPVATGGTQLFNFTGSAVHGGGSCQFLLTYDFPPPEDPTKWRVLQTIIGGCPARAAGNLVDIYPAVDQPDAVHCGNDSGTECVRQFEIPIDARLPSGNATIAWAWFNNIGDREYYMNCAPVVLTGSASDASYYDSLPEMFVANIAGLPGYDDMCITEEGILDIPNPGCNVRTLVAPDPTAIGNCTAAAASATSSGSCTNSLFASTRTTAGSSSAVLSGAVFGTATPKIGTSTVTSTVRSTSTIVSTVTATGSVLAQSAGTSTGGLYFSNTSTVTLTAGPSILTATVGATSTPATTSTLMTSSTSMSNTAATGSGVPCATDGVVVCIGTTQFGLCNFGYAVPQALAAGTNCSNGAITKRGSKWWNA